MRLHLAPPKYRFTEAFEKFVEDHVRSGRRVLDLASKDFRMAAYFNGLHYTGADIDAEALASGKRKHPGAAYVAVQCDILDPPFGDEEFDYVICTNTLVHLPDDGARLAAIQHLVRMTQRGGYLFFNTRLSPVLEMECDRLMSGACGPFTKHCYRRTLCAAYHDHVTVWGRSQRRSIGRLLRVGSFLAHKLDRFGPPTEAIYSGQRAR